MSGVILDLHRPGARVTERLTRAFFRRDSVAVARSLLGQRVVRMIDGRRIAGIIVETEAYLGAEDRAAHTYNGRRTPRNESMWKDGGHVYVYFTYGMHHCVNVVAGRIEQPVAVLLRGLHPTEGLETMRLHRTVTRKQGSKSMRETDLCSGPGKLCQAMGINRELDGRDLVTGSELFIERLRARGYPSSRIVTGPRVGVGYAGDWAEKPLRFFLKGNPHVSCR